MRRRRTTNWGAVAAFLVLLGGILAIVLFLALTVPTVANRVLYPPTATIPPTATPGPCDLGEYTASTGLAGPLANGVEIPVTIGEAEVKIKCENNVAQITGLTLPPKACWLNQAKNQILLDGQVRNIDGEPFKCVNHALVPLNAAQPTSTASPTPTPRNCITPDGFTIPNGGTWKEGLQPYRCVDGGKQPIGNAPATAQPTATSTPLPTATPIAPGTGYCQLPDPDGYGKSGGWMKPGTKVSVQSHYTCDSGMTGRWIDP